MKFIVAHTLAFILALTAFALYIVSFNTPFYIIAKKCKFSDVMPALARFGFRFSLAKYFACFFSSSDLPSQTPPRRLIPLLLFSKLPLS